MRASAMPLASKCRGSYRLQERRGEQPQGNQFARIGNAFHELAKAKVLNGQIDINVVQAKYGLSAEEIEELRRLIGTIDIVIPPTSSAYAEEGLLSEGLDLKGTPDLFVIDESGTKATLIDWKSGWMDVEPPETNFQIIAYAWMILEHFPKLEVIQTMIVQPRWRTLKEFTFTAQFLRDLKPDLTRIIEEADAENAPLTTGPWCQSCFAAMRCPAFAGEIVKISGLVLPDEISMQAKDVQIDAVLKKALPFVKAFERVAKRVEEVAKAYVDFFGPLDLGSGMFFRKTEEDREKIDAAKALPILRAKFPETIDGALTISKSAIEKLAKKTGERGLYGKILKDLESAQAISSQKITKYVFTKESEKTDEPRKIAGSN